MKSEKGAADTTIRLWPLPQFLSQEANQSDMMRRLIPRFRISIGIGHGVGVSPGFSLLSLTRRSSLFPGTHLYTTNATATMALPYIYLWSYLFSYMVMYIPIYGSHCNWMCPSLILGWKTSLWASFCTGMINQKACFLRPPLGQCRRAKPASQ